MKIVMVTVREIDPRDVDEWLLVYRDCLKLPLDIPALKKEKRQSWSETSPDIRTKVDTTVLIAGGGK